MDDAPNEKQPAHYIKAIDLPVFIKRTFSSQIIRNPIFTHHFYILSSAHAEVMAVTF